MKAYLPGPESGVPGSPYRVSTSSPQKITSPHYPMHLRAPFVYIHVEHAKRDSQLMPHWRDVSVLATAQATSSAGLDVILTITLRDGHCYSHCADA